MRQMERQFSVHVKDEVSKAVGPQGAKALAEAIDELTNLALSSQVRWRVMQIESILLERPAAVEMDEP